LLQVASNATCIWHGIKKNFLEGLMSQCLDLYRSMELGGPHLGVAMNDQYVFGHKLPQTATIGHTHWVYSLWHAFIGCMFIGCLGCT
jgi:hypothetical protein